MNGQIFILPPGAHTSLYQPIFFDDVAECIFQALMNPTLSGFFNIPGRDSVTIYDCICELSRSLDKKLYV